MARKQQRIMVPGADKAYDNVLKWLAGGAWEDLFNQTIEEHIGEACDALDVGTEGLMEELGPEAFGVVMTAASEDLLTRENAEGVNVVDDYLKRRGWRETGPGRRYLQALRDSVMSVYEVVEVAPDGHLVLRDLVRDWAPPVRIDDPLSADAVVVWDRLAARVVEVAGRRALSVGVLPFGFDAAEAAVEKLRDTLREGEARLAEMAEKEEDRRPPPPREVVAAVVLGHWAPEFSRRWLRDRMQGPGEGAEAGDGEPLVLNAVRFPYRGDVAAIRARLDAAAPMLVREEGEGGDDEPNWTLRAAAGNGGAAAGTEQGADLGLVALGGDAVVLLASSAEAAEQGRPLLAGLLEGLVDEAVTERVPLDETEEEEEDDEEEAPAGEEQAAGLDEDVDLGAITAKIHAASDEAYRKLLTEPAPELGGKAPREAAASEEGRDRLVTWLKRLENEDAHAARTLGIPASDLRWMWAELGLEDRRR